MLTKLLFIGSFPPPYHGSTVDNQNLLTHWDSSKISLSVLDISFHQKSGAEMGKFSMTKVLSVLGSLMQLFCSVRAVGGYDHCLSHLSQAPLGVLKDSAYIFFLKLFSETKVICRFPGGDFLKFYNNAGMFKCFIRLVLRNIDMVITEGEIVNSQFKKIDPAIRVNAAHIGIPDQNIDSVKIASDRFEVLYICNHRKEKGFWDVLYSLPEIINGNPSILFNFVGEVRLSDREIGKVDTFIFKNSLGEHVKFHGVKIGEEKDRLFSSASIQILPSYSEGLPTSLIEGLCFGLPIVATRVGVIPEIIKDDVNGYLIGPGDREELSYLIIMLSQNPALVREIGKKNREYFLEEFTVQQFCKRLETLILSM